MYIPLLKPTNHFPSHSRGKARDHTMTCRLNVIQSDFTFYSFLFPSLTPCQPQRHKDSTNWPGTAPPQDFCSWYAHWNALPQMPISFPHFLQVLTQKSASRQGLHWPLQLRFHFPIFCCLSLLNCYLTFKSFFFPNILSWQVSNTYKSWKNYTANIHTLTTYILLLTFSVFALAHSHLSVKVSCTPLITSP